MLVLSRRERERVRLGESIVVTIVRVSGDKVRLGIEAPPDVLVLRDELESHRKSQGTPPAALEVELDLPSKPETTSTTALASVGR
ncbi:MAG: carbon storage regulator [Pirellulaceae bacterium]|jgi:carbon storage regulator|nr:carbon storage regulator [Pirellulaceae bacterium]HJN13619.1 carbon storage regulator [Pirellulaceae bacterium]